MNKNNNPADIPASFFSAHNIDEFEKTSASAQGAFDDFEGNTSQIVNNVKGGSGYYAETHHAASFNVNQANANTHDSATLLNSREAGSVDILTESGMAFNPKYYASAEQSYAAGAELIENDGTILAKYTNQQIIVPSDQIDSVLNLHQQQLNDALVSGQTDKYEALSSISFSDRIVGDNGVSSTPLSYHEAQAGSYDLGEGVMPDYAYQTLVLESTSTAVGHSVMAIGMVTAIELAPALLAVLKKLGNDEVTLSDASTVLIEEVKNRRLATKVQQSSVKIASAGSLTYFTDLNAGIATFLVTFGWDVCQLYSQYQNQQISQAELFQRIRLAGMDRGVMSMLTYAAFSIAGPIGLLIPIITQYLLMNVQERQWFEHGLNDVLHSWMRDVSETAQYKSEQWQLAYNLDSNYHSQNNENASMINQKHEKLDKEVQQFNDIVGNDDFKTSIDTNISMTNKDVEATQLAKLKEQNLLLLSQQIDSEEVNQAVERFVIEHQTNNRIFEAAAMDSMAILDSSDHSGNNALSLLAKLKLAVLPSNQLKQQSEQVRTLMTAQIAAMRMLQSLQNDQSMSLEFITFLQQRMSLMADDLAKTQSAQLDSIRQTYESMATVYTKLRDKIIEQSERIDALEKNAELYNWLNLTNTRRDNGKSLMQLEEFERLSVIINEFIQITEGRWRQKDLLVLEEMLHRTDLINLDTQEYIKALSQQPALADILFKQLKIVQQSNSLASTPIASALSEMYLTQVSGSNSHDLIKALPIANSNQYLGDNTVWHLVLMLLWGIDIAGITPYRIEAMEIQKSNWLQALTKVDNLIKEGVLSSWLSTHTKQLVHDIESFKLAVPIIGKYSVGKSTLLNAWLERDIQPINLAACTSIPTEFHYAPTPADEKLILVALDDTNQQIKETHLLANYDLITQGKLSLPPKLQHFELHLHLPALALHPDLVLVDTPGLESNVGSHEVALSQYSGAADSSFILCVSRSHLGDAEKQFVNRQYMFGKPVSLLVCQEDLIPIAERSEVRQTIAIQAEIDEDYGIVRGCSAKDKNLKGLIDILNYIEEQKTQIFDDKYSERINELLVLADEDLAQQLAADNSHEQLQQQKQNIILLQQELNSQYDYSKRKLLSRARGSLSEQVRQNINQALTAQFDHYCEVITQDSSKFESVLHADIQNTFELSVEQIVYPEIRQVAQDLQAAVELKQQSLSRQSALTTYQEVTKQDDGKNMMIGGAAGAGVAVIAGAAFVTTAFIAIPAGIIGGLVGQAYQKNKIRNLVTQQLAQVQSTLADTVTHNIVTIVDNALEQVHSTLSKKLDSEAAKLTKIDEQLALDSETRLSLQQKLEDCKQEINQLITKNTDGYSNDD